MPKRKSAGGTGGANPKAAKGKCPEHVKKIVDWFLSCNVPRRLGRFLFFLWRQLPWVRLRGTVAPMGGPDKFLQKTYGDKAHLSFWQVSCELINLG